MAKKRHIITKDQIRNMERKASREQELEDGNGWTASHKVHPSKKTYNRKNNETY